MVVRVGLRSAGRAAGAVALVLLAAPATGCQGSGEGDGGSSSGGAVSAADERDPSLAVRMCAALEVDGVTQAYAFQGNPNAEARPPERLDDSDSKGCSVAVGNVSSAAGTETVMMFISDADTEVLSSMEPDIMASQLAHSGGTIGDVRCVGVGGPVADYNFVCTEEDTGVRAKVRIDPYLREGRLMEGYALRFIAQGVIQNGLGFETNN